MKTCIPMDVFEKAYKDQIDNISSTCRYALGYSGWAHNALICEGIVEDIKVAFSPSTDFYAFQRWETGFIVAKELLKALREKAENIESRYMRDTTQVDALQNLIHTVHSVVLGGCGQIDAHLKSDKNNREKFYEISDTHFSDIIHEVTEGLEKCKLLNTDFRAKEKARTAEFRARSNRHGM